MIPHKVLNIRGYICICLALFFIFDFIRLLEYHILQFHTFFISYVCVCAYLFTLYIDKESCAFVCPIYDSNK